MSTIFPTAPCKDCPHRSVKCHSTCQSYKDYIIQKQKHTVMKAASSPDVSTAASSKFLSSYFARKSRGGIK